MSPIWGDAPSNPTATNFCMWGPSPEVINYATFHLNPRSSFCWAWPRKFSYPIDLKCDLYNSWSSTELRCDSTTLTAVGAARRRTAFVDVGVSSVFIKRFSCSFLHFSEHEIALLTACINLKFVVRWHHNFGGNLQKFRKFLKISRKSLC